MITFKFDFNPDEFERDILKQLQEEVKQKLTRGGVRNVKVSIDRNHKMNFNGPDEEIEKVKKVLDL